MVFSKCFYWVNAKSASAYCLGIVQQVPEGSPPPPCFGPRASLCKWVSPLPSSPSIYPVPPALVDSPGAHLCVQMPQGLGTSLNILHVSTKRFPFALAGRNEGVPLLWPMKPSGSRYLRLYIQFPSSIISEGDH